MPFLALSPVSVAVFTRLNVSALTTLATGGVTDDPAQGTAFPFVWIEVSERDIRGMGRGSMPEVDLRVHAFSTYAGAKEAQTIIDKVVELLKDTTLTVTGYAQAGEVFYDETTLVEESIINGIKTREMVAFFRIYLEA